MNLSLIAVAISLISPAVEGGHDHGPRLGKVSFQSTCNPAAQALLDQGLGWLHSFQYEAAERVFTQAAAADQQCAIAYWGAAMSNYHPLWVPPTAAELDRGRAAVARARARGAKSKREQDYVAAIETFYRGSDTLDHKTRALAYNQAMAKLHRNYPDDREAAVFYALSLAAVGTFDDDPAFAREKEAAAILNGVLEAEPNHPGVAHYLIHSFDYPPLAHLAVRAAQRYAAIAPASPHAQHMPSHIFTRLGMWEDSIRSNLQSEAAAEAMVREQGFAGSSRERLHAMDYLAYGYLQTGQDAKALQVLADLNAIEAVDQLVFSVAFAATAIPARLALERRQWRDAAALELRDNVRGLAPLDKFAWAGAHIHFARAIGAARIGDSALARDEVAKLDAIERSLTVAPGTYDWKKQVSIQRQVADAWLAYADGKPDQALEEMRAAAELDDATEKHPVTPGAILPAREQLGELLLELKRPAEALRTYEASLVRSPRRFAGLYGAARAARLAGNAGEARRYYAALLDVAGKGDSTRAELLEARSQTSHHAGR